MPYPAKVADVRWLPVGGLRELGVSVRDGVGCEWPLLAVM